MNDGPERRALQQLQAAIAFVPIPSRRPGFSRADEVSGLTLLELALRLDHVTRAHENLHLIDHGHLRRSVSMDLDLRKLSARQRTAVTVRYSTADDGLLAREAERLTGRGGPETARLWIPLARQMRDHLAPVTVTDSSGTVVPRLTSYATSELLIAGMARLLRIQLASRRAVRANGRDGADGAALDIRARWLIERAMAHLIRHGYDVDVEGGPDGGEGSDAHLASLRRQAHEYVHGLTDEHAEELNWLLDVAVGEQLLIAMLPATDTEVHLRYEAPPVPARPSVSPVRLALRNLFVGNHHLPGPRTTLHAVHTIVGARPWRRLAPGRELTVSYHTQLPRIVRSYHLSVETSPEIHVRRFLLVTDADRQAVENLINDLDKLAAHAGKGTFDEVGGDVFRAELQDALARCAALARLRHADLVHYRQYLDRVFRHFGDTLPELEEPAHTADEVVDALVNGGFAYWHLRSLAYHHERAGMTGLGYEPPERLEAALRQLAGYLREAGLIFDLSLDNDPRENGSHTYWANVELPFGPRPTEPINASIHLDLADEPPALIGSVTSMVAAILGVVILLTGLVEWAHRDQPDNRAFGQADAIGAVLLLVPGILLSRLDIPSTRTVLGVLRAFPRRIAYLSVSVTTILAVTVAAQTSRRTTLWVGWGGAACLTALLALCGAEIRARARQRRGLAPSSKDVPRWLLDALALGHLARRGDADITFTTVLPGEPAGTGAPPRQPDTGHPVETVTSAARLVAERATGISFAVTHRFARTTGRDDVLPPFGSHAPLEGAAYRAAVGTFAFALYGTTCEVTTALDRDPRALDATQYLTSPIKRRRERGFSFARGTALVSSNYPSALANVNEILLQLGTGHDLSPLQSLMTAHILARLAALITEHEAIPVWLHAPSAPPAVVTPDHTELAGLSIGPYIRLAMSNSREHGDARIAFEVAVCELATEYGLGVHLSEGRAGFELRTWNRVIPFDESLYRARRATQFDAPPSVSPTEQVMLTLVSPSSRRSIEHLHDLGQIVSSLGIGLHAAAAWQVHQTNFVHLIMPRTTRGRLSADPHELDGGALVGFLATECGTAPERARLAATLPWPAGLHVVLADVVALPQRPDDRTVVPFWVAWDLPGGVIGADRLTAYLMDAFAQLSEFSDRRRHEWVTYLNARRTGRDRWRGRAKVSVDVPSHWIATRDTAAMGRLAKRVQESVVNTILENHSLPMHAVNLHIAWGERWLARPVDW